MAQLASPYGLRPVQLLGGTPYAGSIRAYNVVNNPGGAVYYGSPLALSATGDPILLAASPASGTVSVNSPIGIFMGCEYQDPVRGFVNSQMFPAGGVAAGLKSIVFKILDNPLVVMKAQANGVVPATAVGSNAALVNWAAGSTATGDSTAGISSAVGNGLLAVKIIGFPKDPLFVAGDPFTDVLCIWNAQTHRLTLGASL